jgi:hypothetical protein
VRERGGGEDTVVCYKVLYQNLSGSTEKRHERTVIFNNSLIEILTRDLLNVSRRANYYDRTLVCNNSVKVNTLYPGNMTIDVQFMGLDRHVSSDLQMSHVFISAIDLWFGTYLQTWPVRRLSSNTVVISWTFDACNCALNKTVD